VPITIDIDTLSPCFSSAVTSLLFLIPHDLHVVGQHTFEVAHTLLEHIDDFVRYVTLNYNLVLALQSQEPNLKMGVKRRREKTTYLRILSHTAARSKRAHKQFRHHFEIYIERFEVVDGRDVFGFVPGDTFDGYLRG
jgi:hypothetical protein